MEHPYWITSTWTHYDCIDIMKDTDFELNEHQLCAGLSGLNRVVSMRQHTSTALVFDLMNDRIVSNIDHRHYQSILSVLKARYR